MPKLKISDRERQNRTLIAIIQSGKEMEDISVQKLMANAGLLCAMNGEMIKRCLYNGL